MTTTLWVIAASILLLCAIVGFGVWVIAGASRHLEQLTEERIRANLAPTVSNGGLFRWPQTTPRDDREP
jgi:hypothetical protein